MNTILHGYRAFVAGDLETVAELLDPDIEWFGVDPEQPPANLDAVQTILTARHADGLSHRAGTPVWNDSAPSA